MSTNKINIEAVNARAREEQTPMTLEQMQREGRERLDKQFRYGLQKQVNSNFDDCTPEVRKFLDQHTSNVWMAAQESIKKSILESGLLENKPMTVFSFVLKGEELEQYMRHRGHNQAVEAVKEFMSKMDKV